MRCKLHAAAALRVPPITLVSRTWLSKAGFSICALTKTHRWFFTMKGFTLAALLFLLTFSTRCLGGAKRRGREQRATGERGREAW